MEKTFHGCKDQAPLMRRMKVETVEEEEGGGAIQPVDPIT
jgi:hypothetical protein